MCAGPGGSSGSNSSGSNSSSSGSGSDAAAAPETQQPLSPEAIAAAWLAEASTPVLEANVTSTIDPDNGLPRKVGG